jgi:hypothetical protein
VQYEDGQLTIANKVDSVNSGETPNQLRIPIDENTIAIFHTHGNAADPKPSSGDLKSPVPNFVRSQRSLFVTVPGTSTVIQLPSK